MFSWNPPLLRAVWGLSALACLLAWQGAAHGQGNKNLPVNIDVPIYLKVHDADRWLITPARSGGRPAAQHGDASKKSKHQFKSKEAGTVQIKDGDVIGIEALSTTDEGYVRMYCSDGSWAWYDLADKGNDKQWWTVLRAAGPGVVNHGDNIRLRNVNWPDYYLNFGENGTWATVSKTHTWLTVLLEKPVPPVILTKRDGTVNDIVEDIVYVKNFNDEPLLGAEQKWALAESEEVGLGYEKSDTWDIGVTIGTEVGNDNFKGKVEVSTSFGQTMTQQRTKVKALNISKEVTLNYSLPKNGEAFLKAEIKIPYQVWDASCEDINLQLRTLSASLSLETLEVVAIPRRVNDKIEPVTLEEVEECIEFIARKNPKLAKTLRDTRLPVWQRNGWVTSRSSGTTISGGTNNSGGNPMPQKPLEATALLGSYQRNPVENDWHKGQITAGANNTLVWTNAAGVSWKLTPDLANKTLRTGADNPYANEGVRDFAIELRDGKVAGFSFRGDTFGLVASAPSPMPLPQKPLDATALLGTYQRNPVENDWHKGQITAGANNTLVWTNAAGVSWKLTPDLANKTLRTGADNPYVDQGVRDFAIELKDGLVAGFRFGDDTFGFVAGAPSPEKKSLDAAALVGSYQRNPVENDWHKGQITAGANNSLVWTNAAGVSWKLTPDLTNKALRTGADNPYANQGVRDFTLELKDGKVAGFHFGDDLYQRRP
jgi:hypothetical protein